MVNSTEVTTLLMRISDYVNERNFISKTAGGLMQPRFLYAFSPSAGHQIIDDVLISNPLPQNVFKFSVVPDRSLRMYDVNKIGISHRHLSFFETILCGYVGAANQLPKEEACVELFELFKFFGLDTKKLIVTSLDSVQAEGSIISSSEDLIFYETWKKILGHNPVKKTRGRRNLFYSRNIGSPGGTGCELYYQIGNTYVEIGSQVNYKFKFTGGLERTANAAVMQGFGLERLLMALEGKEHISEVSIIAPIKEVIKSQLSSFGEDETTIGLYDESMIKIADSLRSIIFIVYDAEKDLSRLTKSQKAILTNFKKVLHSRSSELNYLGIYNSEIYAPLIDITIQSFGGRYPNLKEVKTPVLSLLLEEQ